MMAELMSGKKGIIMGVANRKSIKENFKRS
ncbi:hypothetical protein SAMN04488598_11412 [Halanaerobium congolense]|jgi:enoyl-[acyl-carrier-protein] reductase (NADH)|uniref:Uncharacterized protein n=1 Tax=Halanaerobium congolense TaxID=54121 RepID=A0A1G6NWE9_9FIRM|nr:MAG: hypothetical protein AWL62_1563 [Halanaerobium sp. T82-1]PTX17822.1 hypothetical protein C7953_2637 [Halanaerobium congolense]PUU91591.1 MAG: hypothetical protein CI948_1075 [Halanaerobium sp.]PXV60074.1 hypothetical protein C8C78_1617 [Halanaerobium congolense]TDP19167.1 hypothetical protein C8C79_11149 [Halanaerobium congolense]